MKARLSMTPQAAEAIAIQALSFIAADSERLWRFLAVTDRPGRDSRSGANRGSSPGCSNILPPTTPGGRVRRRSEPRSPIRQGDVALGGHTPGSARCRDRLLRDCLSDAPDKARRCPACGSPRLIRHAELDTLTIAHVDAMAFYATIEKRDDPSLIDKPLIVGGGKRRRGGDLLLVWRRWQIRGDVGLA